MQGSQEIMPVMLKSRINNKPFYELEWFRKNLKDLAMTAKEDSPTKWETEGGAVCCRFS